MGYYTGKGVITGGTKSKGLFGTLFYNYGQHVYQIKNVSVLKKSGVALSDCTSKVGKAKASKEIFSSTGDYPWLGITGKTINYSYQQIGDSNLYDLIETTEEMTGTANADNI